jgi:hypothetical protein
MKSIKFFEEKREKKLLGMSIIKSTNPKSKKAK